MCILRTTLMAMALLTIAVSGQVIVPKKEGTITRVVSLLKEMLDKSVSQGDEEAKIYAKFKCYCDTSKAEKSASIENGKETISVVESQIDELQGDTGGLSSECNDLQKAMAENKDARESALTLRNKENKAFRDEKADLEKGVAQMSKAIDTLAAVGADQTKSTGADNKQFMAGRESKDLAYLPTDKSSYLKLLQTSHKEVEHALRAAAALLSPEQQKTTASFLQAPFTGTYTSQSGAVMGIIKSMRDTFEKNLKDSANTERNSQESFEEFTAEKEKAHKEMKDSYEEKQSALGGNDGDLDSKRAQLDTAEKQLADDESFLKKLLPTCKEKAKGFANRKELRANEEAAIAEAISILNSDKAFASFGTTDATSVGSTGPDFIQLRAVHKHVTGTTDVRHTVQGVLQDAAMGTKSLRLSKVVALLQTEENPFDDVLDEIANMIELIGEEGKADKEKMSWCDKERNAHDDTVADKKKEILSLKTNGRKLTNAIQGVKGGLISEIAKLETSLSQNRDSQVKQTADRTEGNVAYQQDVRNLVNVQSTLSKAIKVLQAYYEDLEDKLKNGEAFVQEDPDTGEAWKGDGAYTGQKGQGNAVLKMLNYILEQTGEEETMAHKDEQAAQHKFETSMADLKDKEASAMERISKLQEKKAKKEKALLANQEDLRDTTDDKEETQDLLAKIKPGCDFITDNFKLRNDNRATEKAALEKARRLIKASPHY
jgi:hypothetical protein